FVFDERQNSDEPVFCRKLEERPAEVSAKFTSHRGVAMKRGGIILGKLCFLARMPGVVQNGISNNAVGPGAKVSSPRVEPLAGPVNAPKRLHGQILSNADVANDADGPAVNFVLVLAKENLKSFEIAHRKSLEQFHALLSIPSYSF